MSVRVLSWVWDHSGAKGNDLLVLLAIADNANDEGTAYPGVTLLARKTKLHSRTVQRSLRTLRTHGELKIEFNKGGSDDLPPDKRPNLYTIKGYVATRQIATPDPSGVTETSERGDSGGTRGVAALSPKPSLNRQEPGAVAGLSSVDDRSPCPSDGLLVEAEESISEARKRLAGKPRKTPRRKAS